MSPTGRPEGESAPKRVSAEGSPVSARDRFGKVAVLLGGPSSEREISLLSGNAVLAALVRQGVDAHAFDPAERDLWALQREGFERAFIALHGRFGEDGTIQGVLETLRVPYTGSGVQASSIAIDKLTNKRLWEAEEIPTPASREQHAHTDFRQIVAELGDALIVKPVREGSTIGITKVTTHDSNELAAAFETALRYDDVVIAEELISGRELTCAIIGAGETARSLPLVEIRAPDDNYD